MDVCAPVGGRVVALAEVPDPVFAAAMVGPGSAVDPGEGRIVARTPIAGVLRIAKPHAFVVEAAGRGVLVHLGIDTISLGGAGFDLLAAPGDVLVSGDPVVNWDPAPARDAGLASHVVVVALARGARIELTAPAGATVAPGDTLFRWL